MKKVEEAKRTGQPLQTRKLPQNEYLPIRVRARIEPGQKMGSLGVETVAGRGYWLFSIKHLLTSTIRLLLEHRWTVLNAHENLFWFTSDDPVVRLNFNDGQHYDLKGGWGSKGTEIFLPLSPRHLLYTQVGKPLPQRGWAFSYEQTSMLRKIIAEHAPHDPI